ncbi:hypothetical protein ONS95_005698 [Cadophora gregata]|uniref:uncharacterized protein n=1 Tax=Cadophora gregata TaxID=51156 RepID=UPI0026DB6054|nr:uncharacterized protein ONS95_005698 [Cadophora gregata]KAK0103688.1 hypothetical protein ONS95_005698 [Cadophora gregata]KAK0107878.1 hypothetical protein ONS96_003667 [Cadophora gregata f. sp. sojae]
MAYPGLDLVTVPNEDPAGDYLAGLTEWALAMLKENKNQGNSSLAIHSAVTSNPESTFSHETEPSSMGYVDMGGFTSLRWRQHEKVHAARKKAEKQGLVRRVENVSV